MGGGLPLARCKGGVNMMGKGDCEQVVFMVTRTLGGTLYVDNGKEVEIVTYDSDEFGGLKRYKSVALVATKPNKRNSWAMSATQLFVPLTNGKKG